MSDQHPEMERTGFEVAVIGAAGRFPGARNLDEYWDNLCAGLDTISRFSDEELAEAGVSEAQRNHPDYVGAFPAIGDLDQFDAAFFNYSPRETEIIDPQVRLLMESAWHTLEDAGYDPETFPGLIGVFGGSRLSSYVINIYRNPKVYAAHGELAIQFGNDKDYLVNRISYKLDLGGPSVTVQSACSTALVAVHLGCQSLIAGESDIVLAGATTGTTPENRGYQYSEGQVVSKSGVVRPFSADADGTIFGNGVGMMALKRLDDALADGDRVMAVIKGSAVSNDGARKVGYTAPGVDGQRRVIRAAQIAAEVEPDTISYIEAHGTGTNLGDPIEMDALTKAFRERTERVGYCAIGSVKGNIGHLAAAAGVAGMVKAIYSLQHKKLAPSLHCERPHEGIEWAGSPFFVNTELRDWELDGQPVRRVGVSAFGIGGTNGHVILEEAPDPGPPEPSPRSRELLLISARTESALDTATENMARHLEEVAASVEAGEPLELADVAFTLARGRRAFEHRRAVVAEGLDDAVSVLSGQGKAAGSRVASGTPSGQPGVVFMFSGQGSQHVGMGRDLYDSQPVFAREIDRAAEILRPHLGLDLKELLYPAESEREAAAEKLGETRFTQPALFAVEVALARLWMSWGIEPVAMIGHSIGELVAATLAGVFSLEDGLALVAERGRLMQEQPAGDMVAVPLAEDELEGLLGPELALAAVNAPSRSVVSGPADAVAALVRTLEDRGVSARPLHTSHAFHSGMMESMLGPFLDRFDGVELSEPQIPFVSNVTGTWITPEEATDPGYWVRHVRSAVRFAAGLAELGREGGRVYLEVGPGKSLATLARQNPARGAGAGVLASMRHPKDVQAEGHDLSVLLEALGRLWIAGVKVNWDGYFDGEARRRVRLPLYPFERQRYWVEPDMDPAAFTAPADLGPKEDLGDWFNLVSWRPSVTPTPSPPSEGDTDTTSPWLLFDAPDGSPLGDALRARLANLGRPVATVEPMEPVDGGDGAPGFERLERGRYRSASNRESLGRLLAALADDGLTPRRALHLWTLADDRPAESPETLAASQELGFWSLLGLAQALGSGGGSMALGVVTAGSQQVGREDVPHPERATVLGPCRVIPQELPRLAVASIDLDPASAQAPDDALVASLVAELEADLPDAEVAYRDGERFLAAVEPVHLGPVPTAGASPLPPRVEDGAVILVTGGLGGFGLSFADHFARQYKARLVLTSRRGPDDPKVENVGALEEAGAEVLVLAADVTDPDSMDAAVRSAMERFGRIDGVVHAAGVAGGGLIPLKTREAAQAVLDPKLTGTVVLEKALEDAGAKPAFLVLCSSTIALLGGIGQVDYSAANSFLDAFATSRRGRRDRYTVSLNWGAWKEVGMAVETPVSSADRSGTPAPPKHDHSGPRDAPLLGDLVEETAERRVWRQTVSSERHWVVDEHRIGERPVMPGTAYLEMLVQAADALPGDGSSATSATGPVEVHDLLFMQPIVVPDGESREVRLTATREEGGDVWNVRVASAASPDGPWTDHARGRLERGESKEPEALDLVALAARCDQQEMTLAGDEFEKMDKAVYWGPRWRSLRHARIGEGEAVIRLELPEEFRGDLDGLALHPALMDVATSVGSGLVANAAVLPLAYKTVRVHGALPERFVAHVDAHDGAGRETLNLDVTLTDEDGRVLVEVEQFTMKKVGDASPAGDAPAAAGLLAGGGMAPEDGVEALMRVLARSRYPRIAITQRDLEAMIARSRERRPLDADGPDGAEGGAGETTGASGPAAGTGGTLHPRPNLTTAYLAPTTPSEVALAEVWASVLGLEEVGVDDNFFELGGDSILGIQVISQAGQRGIELAPDQLFELQTVAELAAAVGPGSDGDDAVTPTPFQSALLGRGSRPGSLWLTLALDDAADRGDLEAALTAVARAHPAVGLRLRPANSDDDGSVLGSADGLPSIPFDVLDGVDASDRPMDDLARDLVAGLDPAERPLAALLVTPEDGCGTRLLLAASRALFDETSLTVLAEDLVTARRRIADGESPDLPLEGRGFAAWARSLDNLGDDLASEPALASWLDVARTQAAVLPTIGEGASGGVAIHRSALDEVVSVAVVRTVSDAFRAEPGEVLLAALVGAISEVSGTSEASDKRPVLVRLEQDGRADSPGELDRAVGCFTVAAPLLVETSGASAEALLAAAKGARRGLVRSGLGHALVLAGRAGDRSAAERLEAMPRAQVGLVGAAALSGAENDRGWGRSAPSTPVELRLGRRGDRLSLDWIYDPNQVSAETVGELARATAAGLERLAEAARTADGAAFDPTDFPEADLSSDDLDSIFSQLEGDS